MRNAAGTIISVCVMALLAAGVPVLLHGCGGGGGGGGWSPPPLTSLGADNASASVAALDAMGVMNDLLIVGSGADAGGGAAAAAVAFGGPQTDLSLHAGMVRLLDRVAVEAQTGSVHALGFDSYSGDCLDGGSQVVSVSWDGPQSPVNCSQISNLRMVLDLSDCLESGILMDGRMEVSVPGSSCGLIEGDPLQINVKFNGTLIDDASGLTVTYENFSIKGSNLAWSEFDIIQMDLLIDGSVSGTFGVESFDASFDTMNASLRVDSDETHGSYYAMTLDGYIRTDCLGGWLEVTTTQDILIGFDFDCPFGGVYTLRGSDGEASVEFSDTGVEIYIDGELVDFYPSCGEIPSCLDA